MKITLFTTTKKGCSDILKDTSRKQIIGNSIQKTSINAHSGVNNYSGTTQQVI